MSDNTRPVRLAGGIQFPPASEFPSNPTLGRPVFKDNILYIYAELAGQKTWYPLNQPRATHVHEQTIATQSVVINHGLGTKDVMVMIQDANGYLLDADVQSVEVPENPFETRYQVHIELTEAETFKVVTFATDVVNAPGVVTEYLNAQSITVNNDPVVTQTELQAALDEMSARTICPPVSTNAAPAPAMKRPSRKTR